MANPEKTLASQALARGGAPGANPLKTHDSFFLHPPANHLIQMIRKQTKE